LILRCCPEQPTRSDRTNNRRKRLIWGRAGISDGRVPLGRSAQRSVLGLRCNR